MPLVTKYWRCPKCLNDQEPEFNNDGVDADLNLFCSDCKTSISVKLRGEKLVVVGLCPDGEQVEIAGHTRSESGSILVKIKPLDMKTYESGVNPYCHARALIYKHPE